MGIDLRGGDVGMAEQRLEHAEVGAARQQMRGKGVAQHVRADPIGRDARVSGHCADDLEQPHPADVRSSRSGTATGCRSAPCPATPRRLRRRARRSAPAAPCPLAPHDQERLARPHRAARQADQLARAKARAIKQFEQRKVAQRAGSPLAARSSAASNIRSISGSSRIRGSGRSRRGRGSAAEGSSCLESRHRPGSRKTAEAPPSAGQPWTAQGPPTARPAAKDRRAPRRASGSALGGSLQIVAIGGQRVPRRARLCRHHVEEPVDERLGRSARHVRDRASAAIIRAVKSWPVRLSAGDRVVHVRGRQLANCGVWKPVPVSTSTVPACPRPARGVDHPGPARSTGRGRGHSGG